MSVCDFDDEDKYPLNGFHDGDEEFDDECSPDDQEFESPYFHDDHDDYFAGDE